MTTKPCHELRDEKDGVDAWFAPRRWFADPPQELEERFLAAFERLLILGQSLTPFTRRNAVNRYFRVKRGVSDGAGRRPASDELRVRRLIVG
jgi:hypothetical protein